MSKFPFKQVIILRLSQYQHCNFFNRTDRSGFGFEYYKCVNGTADEERFSRLARQPFSSCFNTSSIGSEIPRLATKSGKPL